MEELISYYSPLYQIVGSQYVTLFCDYFEILSLSLIYNTLNRQFETLALFSLQVCNCSPKYPPVPKVSCKLMVGLLWLPAKVKHHLLQGKKKNEFTFNTVPLLSERDRCSEWKAW